MIKWYNEFLKQTKDVNVIGSNLRPDRSNSTKASAGYSAAEKAAIISMKCNSPPLELSINRGGSPSVTYKYTSVTFTDFACFSMFQKMTHYFCLGSQRLLL